MAARGRRKQNDAGPPAPRPSGPVAWAYPGLAALLTVVVLAPGLAFPFGRDQAVFAYVGRLIAEGGMPYRDAWDLKPPGIYLAYAALARLAGEAPAALVLAVRVADTALAALTGVLLALYCRRLGRPEFGPAAAAWYAALYLQGGFWSVAQAEAWANPLVLGSGLLLLAGRAPALAGALAGGAVVLKFTSLLPVLAFLPALAAGDRQSRRWAWFAAGAAAAPLAAAAWLVAGDAWNAFLDIQRGFVAPYTRLSAGSPGERLAGLGSGLAAGVRHYWGPLALAALALAPRRPAPADSECAAGRAVWVALALGALAVALQAKFFLYHWAAALPFLALLAALGAGRVGERLRRWSACAALLPALAWTFAARGPLYADAAALALGQLPPERWESRFSTGADFDHSATRRAAARLSELAVPGDAVLVWGFEPDLYLQTATRAPTRFFFNVPVAVEFTPPAWRAEFLAALRADPPLVLVVLRRDAIPWATGEAADSEAQLAAWPELSAWVRDHYTPAGRVEDFRFVRRQR